MAVKLATTQKTIRDLNMMILRELEVRSVEELQEEPSLLRKEVLVDNVKHLIKVNRELRKEINLFNSETTFENSKDFVIEDRDTHDNENGWKRKYQKAMTEISKERKLLLRETGKLTDACFLVGIAYDFGQNDEISSATGDDIERNILQDGGSVYANYIVENRLNKVMAHILRTKQFVKRKDAEMDELKSKIDEMEKSPNRPGITSGLSKQKTLPPLKSSSGEILTGSPETTKAEVASDFRPRAATYSSGCSPRKPLPALSTNHKIPNSEPDLLLSHEKTPLKAVSFTRSRRRSGLSMIQAGIPPSPPSDGARPSTSRVHFIMTDDDVKQDDLSPRRKFSHPSKLESYSSPVVWGLFSRNNLKSSSEEFHFGGSYAKY